MDDSELNRSPKSILGIFYRLKFNSRYSMTVWFRLSQYYFMKSLSCNRILKIIYQDLSNYYSRKNQIKNGLTSTPQTQIGRGIVFHHTNIIITSDTVIEEGVEVYGNVTFGLKDGKAPIIKSKAKIAGNSMVLGGVIVGEGAIVAPMALVLSDVPPGKIAAGIPAKVIGDVNEKNIQF
ncbi:MAG: hypothetical protein ACFFDN_28645 [Candidatus Hodarchaeota archaeon]